jgi:hypothetical protein
MVGLSDTELKITRDNCVDIGYRARTGGVLKLKSMRFVRFVDDSGDGMSGHSVVAAEGAGTDAD